jgi:hypothetical protein
MFKDLDNKLDLKLMNATPYDCGVVVLNADLEPLLKHWSF